MSIYTSEKVLPYVYQCTHKITGKFYIGSRYTKDLKLPSHLDFPIYRTSSKTVKPNFDEYDWIILAEFFDGIDAFMFEQHLIKCNFNNIMILNKVYHDSELAINIYIASGKSLTEYAKSKISKANKGYAVYRNILTGETKRFLSKQQPIDWVHINSGRVPSKEQNEAHSQRMKGKPSKKKGIPLSEETKKRISDGVSGENNPFYGKTHSQETKDKISNANSGNIPWNKGLETSQEVKDKISNSKLGKSITPRKK